MELAITLAQQIFSMILMIFVGYLAVKKNILTYEAGSVLSTLTVYILCPCLIFSACQIDYSPDKLKGLLIGIAAAIAVHILFIPLSRLIARIFPMDELDRASLIYSNSGNLIVPLIGAILGGEYVFYSSAYLAVQTILFWTHGIRLVTGEKGSIKKILLNPNIIATAVGIAFFLLPIKLPSLLEETVDKIGGTIGPISMFSIGILMSSVPLKKAFTSLHAYLIVFLRLIVMPLIFVLCVFASHLAALSPLTGKVMVATVLAAAGPTAVSIAQNTQIHGKEAAGAGMVNVMSTLLCVITMPLIILVYQLLCL